MKELFWTIGPVILSFVVIIGITRLFGPWMLRINEVIKIQKEILSELKKLNSSGSKS